MLKILYIIYTGQHDIPASVGITGSIEFIELEGPEVILALTGKFWHRRGMLLNQWKFCTYDVHKKNVSHI